MTATIDGPRGLHVVEFGPFLDLRELYGLSEREWNLLRLGGIRGGMGTTANFASGPNVASGIVSATLDTSLTAPTNVTSLTVGGASGTKVNEVVYQGLGTTVAATINQFLHDGSTYHLHKQYLVNAVTASTTAVAYRIRDQFTDLIVKNGWTLKFTQTVAGNQSMIKGIATGGDF